MALEFLTKESEFVYGLYQAAELEVRSTERYVLVTLGALYSYLATRAATDIPPRFRPLAWYTPVGLVVFAGIRALGLGLRQHWVLKWLERAETRVLPRDGVPASVGWANFSTCHPWVLSTVATIFYVFLF